MGERNANNDDDDIADEIAHPDRMIAFRSTNIHIYILYITWAPSSSSSSAHSPLVMSQRAAMRVVHRLVAHLPRLRSY